MDKTKLQWHPAFGAALRITLQDEMKYLEMHEEHLLSKKPLQMDILIIKKTSMQLLIVPQMADEENYWIQSMRTDLRAGEEIQKLMREYEKHRKLKDYGAVMNLITRANWEQMEVEKKMCDALNELFAEELREAESRGRTEGMKQEMKQGVKQGKREMIFAFLKAGADIKMIKEASGLNEEEIELIRREMEQI